MGERNTRQKKRVFYGCGNYPTCNFAIWEKPVPEPCPKCGGLLVVTRPGQDPVCYQEVIVPQRNAQEKPLQDGEQKTTRKRVAKTEDELPDSTTTKSTRRVSTRKKAISEETELAANDDETRKITKKTATPRATTKRTGVTTTNRVSRQASTTNRKSPKKTPAATKKTTNNRKKTVQ